ncbi:uncharacterized protein [Narcine bancroftii]|uniref:uncharacterized protein isoform X3 n=1 Tax=Narcine bancroftii TaxID=1343680 RepID=UPI0038310AEE
MKILLIQGHIKVYCVPEVNTAAGMLEFSTSRLREKTGGTVDVVISATSLQHQRSGLESNIVRSLYILSCLQEFSLETLVSSHCSKRTSFHVLAL